MRELVRVETPLRMSGLRPALVGTVVWAAVLVTLLAGADRSAGSPRWWLWTAVTGTAVGLFALVVLTLRRARQRSSVP